MPRRASPCPSASPTTGICRNALPLQQLLHRSRIRIRCTPGTSTASRPRPGRSSAIPIWPRPSALLQAKGRDAFYKGEIARAIVAKSNALGGTMTLEDLADYKGEWVEPVLSDLSRLRPLRTAAARPGAWPPTRCSTSWRPAYRNGLSGPDAGLARARRCAQYWHLLIEAKKLAYADLYRLQRRSRISSAVAARAELLSQPYAKACAARSSRTRRRRPARADGNGTLATPSCCRPPTAGATWCPGSTATSAGFGSGITVPGYGFLLHNRGGLFTLDPKSPNVIAPHKRPFNTLAAGFVMQ